MPASCSEVEDAAIEVFKANMLCLGEDAAKTMIKRHFKYKPAHTMKAKGAKAKTSRNVYLNEANQPMTLVDNWKKDMKLPEPPVADQPPAADQPPSEPVVAVAEVWDIANTVSVH